MTSEGISFLASGIGKPLFLDDLSSNLEPLNFFRVCIEVNADFSFPPSIDVIVVDEDTSEDSVVTVEVEYQSKPPSCSACKVFGHSPLKCHNNSFKWVPKGQSADGYSDPKNGFGVSTSKSGLNHAVKHGGTPNTDSIVVESHMDARGPCQEWVTVSRGAKGQVKETGGSNIDGMNISNSFSPIGSEHALAMAGSDIESPLAANPLIDKLRVVDEKEGKDLKHKSRGGGEPSQDAKRRKGKGNKSPH